MGGIGTATKAVCYTMDGFNSGIKAVNHGLTKLAKMNVQMLCAALGVRASRHLEDLMRSLIYRNVAILQWRDARIVTLLELLPEVKQVEWKANQLSVQERARKPKSRCTIL